MKVFLILLTSAALLLFIVLDELRAVAAVVLLSNLFLVMRGGHKNSLSTEFSQNIYAALSSVVLTIVIYLSAAGQITSLTLVFVLITFYALYSICSACSLVASKLVVLLRKKLFW